jgi:hypothetical protein
MASTISAGTTSATALVHTADTSGALQLATNNGTVAVTIDTSQKVGIGTSSPTQKVSIAGGLSFNSALSFTGSGYEIGRDGADFLCFSAGSAGTRFINASTATEFMRLDTSSNLQFNSGYGSVAVAYGCRAWVNFNGTGTVAIRASGNVSSITDNGTGDYTVNFTTAMPDANYSANVGTAPAAGYTISAGAWWGGVSTNSSGVPVAKTSSAVRIVTANAQYNNYDSNEVNFAAFR